MSSLALKEKAQLERLLDMGNGYVLNFSDATFGTFFAEQGIDIHAPKYQSTGTSKGKKLREFWKLENDLVVGAAITALVDYYDEQFKPSIQEKKELSAQCRATARRLLGATPNLDGVKAAALVFDAKYLHNQIKRMEQAQKEGDVELAIGTAKELIETCCKTILAERGAPVQGTPDIPELAKAVFQILPLVPSGISDEARAATSVKILLNNLIQVPQKLGELRNTHGTGHGKHSRATGLPLRHAKLAVGAAAAVATFLFETHQETKK